MLISGFSRAADDSAAKAVVEKLHESLLVAMNGAAQLGFKGRAELLAPVLESSFDFESICRIVTGRYWKSASDDQKTRFTSAFKKLSVATYASNFSSFSGEKFQTEGSEADHEALIVRTTLRPAKNEPVTLNYLLRPSNDGWRIMNVVAQGVSDLSLKRADYTAVIKKEGFDSLINRLEKKTVEMSKDP
jgi:phospholipid transport system substrate-binding protein